MLFVKFKGVSYYFSQYNISLVQNNLRNDCSIRVPQSFELVILCIANQLHLKTVKLLQKQI